MLISPDRRVEFCFRIIEFHELDPNWHTHTEMDQAIFQQDVAPPHFANPVKRLLNDNLPGRWNGRGSDFFRLATTILRFNCV
ncbi:hypothetical protein J6590_078923 [Homalodisca vitripennis]|nr:hypothetical protein J6590_078923 [Homalodisca vitripennis]